METPTPSLREQGMQALRAGNPSRAVDLLSQAVLADPHDEEAQALLGVAYSQQGLHAQAKQALQEAVARQPQSPHYHFNLGVALERGGDPEGAARSYRETLRLQTEHAQARTRLQALASGALARVPPTPRAAKPGGAPWLGTQPSSDAGPAAAPAPWLRAGGSSAPMAAPAVFEAPPVPGMGAGEAFLRRLVGEILDDVIVSVASYAVFFVLALLLAAMTGGAPPPGGGPGGPSPGAAAGGLAFLAGLIAFVALPLSYCVGMLVSRGQTLGKMAVGIRVVDATGENPGFGQALLRETIGKLCSMLLFFLGYLWMLWDGEQQAWHDKIAGTYVGRVDAPVSRPAGIRAARPAQSSSGLLVAAVLLGGMFVLLPIVAAILFPVFAQARERARATVCMSNVKRLGLGMMMYAQDYDEYLPDRQDWGDALLPYVRNPAAYQCPSLPGERGAYAYNGWLSRASMKQLDDPSTTIAGFDSRGGWNLAGGPDLAAARHYDGLTVLFADGHARWMRELGTVVWKPRHSVSVGAARSTSRRGRHRSRRRHQH